jgi:hypothetical protein
MNGFSIKDVRALRIINKTINELELDLDGLNILTEVGSNNYLYTPLIPLLARAKTVTAFVRDTAYGSADEIEANCYELVKQFGFEDRLTILKNHIPRDIFRQADIVTNSGMLRPLNKEKIELLKEHAVIPLMYEEWELRPNDVDIDFCRTKGIKVGGTSENHPGLEIFDFVGPLGIKMMFEAGLEVKGNNIFIWSGDNFGAVLEQAFNKAGAANVICSRDQSMLFKNAELLDAVFIADYNELRNYTDGTNAPFDLNKMLQAAPSVKIVHLYGQIPFDAVQCKANVYPQTNGKAKQMSFTLDHVGPIPSLRLQVAGFKVGEELYKNRLTALTQPIV